MRPMPATAAHLYSRFNELGIAYETIEHPPFFTVEEGRAWHAKIPGLHCKNLFLKDKKGGLWLVVMPGEKRADLARIARETGAVKFSFGSAETLQNTLGITPGSVTPFALINDLERKVRVVLDKDMMQAELVNYHPLENTASTTLRASDLMKFIRALGYDPSVIDCGQEV